MTDHRHQYEDVGAQFSANGDTTSRKTMDCAFRWEPLTASQLAGDDYRPEYLIRGLLVARQPAFVIGGSKTLKTTIGLDAAIALASGTAVLGEFCCPHPRRVAFLSGESGEFTIQE